MPTASHLDIWSRRSIGREALFRADGDDSSNKATILEPGAVRSTSDIARWLIAGTQDERFIDEIFVKMCARLRRLGIPLKWASLHLEIRHPQWLGARIVWADGQQE